MACRCSSCCRCVWLRGCCYPMQVCVASWLFLSYAGVCAASWLAVVLHAPGVGVALMPPAAYCLRAPHAGAARYCPVRRRSPINGSISGFFLIGYSSICQLFKFSYGMLCAKVFTGENFIKTLFSANYRGYFIIRAAHPTTNYSHFYIKHTENMRKTNKIVKNHHKMNKKLLIIWFIGYKYLSLHH